MSGPERALVIGADVGGSSTRVVVVDAAGTLWSRVDAAGANPNAVGPAAAAAEIRAAAGTALAAAQQRLGSAVPPLAMVLGLAGGSRVAADQTFLAAVSPSAAMRPRVVSDLEIAYSSATEEASGCVLIAGTGAVAGRVVDARLVQVHDGWGWLLGDGGAGFWLGREAVRATLRRLESGDALEDLHRAVLAAAGADDRIGLVGACYAAPPLWLAGLAPLVSSHAAADPGGDAHHIASAAADQLVELVGRVAIGGDGPLVLAGSVATSPGPIADTLRDRLREALDPHGGPVLTARSGLVGAAWSALRDAGAARPGVHRVLASALDDAR